MKNSSVPSRAFENAPYQQHIAVLLLETMSSNDAIQYCVENGWEGVLSFVLPAAYSAEYRRSLQQLRVERS